VIAANCPSHVYLGNNPNGTNWPDWSEDAQGIANDGQHWFFTRKGGLFKYDANWQPIDGDDIGKLGQVGIPPALEDIGSDHLGDPDYYAGYVFVPLEGVQYVYVPPEGVLAGWWKRIRIAGIAAFRASDLAFVDWVNVSAFQPKAGWVAIDPVEHMLYTSDDHIVAGTPLLRYSVDVSKI